MALVNSDILPANALPCASSTLDICLNVTLLLNSIILIGSILLSYNFLSIKLALSVASFGNAALALATIILVCVNFKLRSPSIVPGNVFNIP